MLDILLRMSLAQRLIVRLYMSRGCSSGSGNRCTRLWLSRRSLDAFLEGVNPPSCANSRSCKCRVRPAYRNIVRSRHDNARLGCTRHHLAHVLSRALDPKAIYVPWLPCWVGVQVYSTVVIQTFARGVSGRRVSAIMRDQQKLQVRPG